MQSLELILLIILLHKLLITRVLIYEIILLQVQETILFLFQETLSSRPVFFIIEECIS